VATSYAIDSLAAEKSLLALLRQRFATENDRPCERVLTYHDTFDWRLFASGTMLAVGTEDGQPVVRWSTLDGRSLHRLFGKALSDPARELPEGAFRTALLTRIESRRLVPVVRVEQRVHGLRLLDDEGKTVARATVERGVASAPEAARRRRLPATLSILPLGGYDDEASSVARLLEQEQRLEAASTSPLLRALGAIGRRAADVDTSFHVALERSTSAEAAMRAILIRLCELMRLNEPGVRDDLDPEFLHDYRVAMRRTRTLLGRIKRVLPKRQRRRFREEFKWLGDVTGPVRDLDVHLLELPECRSWLPESQRGVVDRAEQLLAQRKRESHALLVAELSSARHVRLFRDWSRFLNRGWGPAEKRPAALLPAADVASPAIRRAFERLTEHGANLDEHSPPQQLHRLRIDGKRLRYLLESFRRLYDAREVRVLVKHLKRLQDNLGAFNDREVQQRTISALGAELAATGEDWGPALARLTEVLEERQRVERQSFAESFARFASATNVRRVRTLFGDGGPS
jgi:CHAD domain-containing protein